MAHLMVIKWPEYKCDTDRIKNHEILPEHWEFVDN